MGQIRNTVKADITVSTKAGKFVFPAGRVSGDLADDRLQYIQEAGAVYFASGDLIVGGQSQVPEPVPVPEPEPEQKPKAKGRPRKEAEEEPKEE